MSRPDELQAKLFKELKNRNALRPLVVGLSANLAKRLGVDEETVRTRLKNLMQSGLLEGWQLMLNPHLIGREASNIELDCGDVRNKPKMLAQIQLIEGVVLTFDFYDTGLRVLLYHSSDRDFKRKIQLMTSICGSTDAVYWKGIFPRCEMRMRLTDWRVLRDLVKDPTRHTPDIAKELRVSTRTVKRRTLLMTAHNAFHLIPRVNFRKFPGFSFAYSVYVPDEEKKEIVDSFIQTKLGMTLYVDTGAQQYSSFAVACDTVSEADRIYTEVKGFSGVKNVRMNAVKSMSFSSELFDQVIEEQLRRVY